MRPATCGRTGKKPEDTIPIGPTKILARTDLVRAAPMGGLVQGEDYVAALGVTSLAPGILLPVPVYRYRKHPGQMTRQDDYDVLEARARQPFEHFRVIVIRGSVQ